MILVRDVFEIAPEGMREVVAGTKVGQRVLENAGVHGVRFMTDLTGPFYVLVLESIHEDLGAWETMLRETLPSEEGQAWYSSLRKHVRGGRREVFKLLD